MPLLKLHSAIVFLEILYFMDLKAFSLSAEWLKGMWTSKLRILLYYVLDQYFTSHWILLNTVTFLFQKEGFLIWVPNLSVAQDRPSSLPSNSGLHNGYETDLSMETV